MRKFLLTFIAAFYFMVPNVTFAQQPAPHVAPRHQVHLRATASSHVINFSWTAFTSNITGIGVDIFCGPTSGGETNTPVNPTPLATTAGAFQQTGVAGGQTLYCEANSVVGSGTSQ